MTPALTTRTRTKHDEAVSDESVAIAALLRRLELRDQLLEPDGRER